jgi:hypothetical protein
MFLPFPHRILPERVDVETEWLEGQSRGNFRPANSDDVLSLVPAP